MGNFNVAANKLKDVTFSQLTQELEKTAQKFDGKSIRLHFSGTEKNETATFKVHTSRSNLFKSSERDSKRLQARAHVKEAMIREFNIDKETAEQMLGKVCSKSDRITLGELKSLKSEFQNAKELKKFHEGTFEDLVELKDNWKPSDLGATGAIKIMDESLPGGGVILKCESPQDAKAISGTSAYISEVSNKLAEKGLQLPVGGMLVRPMTFEKESVDIVIEKLKSKVTDKNEAQTKNSTQRLECLKKDLIPMQAMLLKGTQDISDLSLGRRIGLVKSNGFPQSLGAVMVLSKLFGLNDHVGLGIPDDNRRPQGHLTNLSNLRIDPETDRLSLIDYSLVNGGRGIDNEGHVISGFTNQHIMTAFTKLKDIALQCSTSPHQSLEMLRQRQDVIGEEVDFTQFFDQIDVAYPQGTLFVNDKTRNINEKGAIESFTATDKNKYFVNTLIGVLDALKLIAENSDAFTSGTPMFDKPEQVMQHVQNLAGDIDKIKEKLLKYVSTH